MTALLTAPPRNPVPLLSAPRGSRRPDRARRPPCTSQFDDDDRGSPFGEPEEPSELDDPTFPETDDDRWEVFLPDDEPYEPRPEPGDFWIDAEEE